MLVHQYFMTIDMASFIKMSLFPHKMKYKADLNTQTYDWCREHIVDIHGYYVQ